MLTLCQIVRLLPAAPFNRIRQLTIREAYERFEREGAFPVAIYFHAGGEAADTQVETMMVALVVGVNRGHMAGYGVFVQTSTTQRPIILTQVTLASAGYHTMYNIDSGQINLRPDQVAAMTATASTLVPTYGVQPPLPPAIEPAVFVRPELLPVGHDDTEDEGGDDWDAEDDAENYSADDAEDYGEDYGEDSGEDYGEDSGEDYGEHDPASTGGFEV